MAVSISNILAGYRMLRTNTSGRRARTGLEIRKKSFRESCRQKAGKKKACPCCRSKGLKLVKHMASNLTIEEMEGMVTERGRRTMRRVAKAVKPPKKVVKTTKAKKITKARNVAKASKGTKVKKARAPTKKTAKAKPKPKVTRAKKQVKKTTKRKRKQPQIDDASDDAIDDAIDDVIDDVIDDAICAVPDSNATEPTNPNPENSTDDKPNVPLSDSQQSLY